MTLPTPAIEEVQCSAVFIDDPVPFWIWTRPFHVKFIVEGNLARGRSILVASPQVGFLVFIPIAHEIDRPPQPHRMLVHGGVGDYVDSLPALKIIAPDAGQETASVFFPVHCLSTLAAEDNFATIGIVAGLLPLRQSQWLDRPTRQGDEKKSVETSVETATIGTEQHMLTIGVPANNLIGAGMPSEPPGFTACSGDDVHIFVASHCGAEGDELAIW
ncbi:MAG: hypothetical protein KKH79_03150 [Candidatus Thermoplasmatota archaeon]|nr:hypothetical protein [Candidatus Thermoplasmatota archaeon]